MDNYRRPRDVVLPTPGPVPEHIRKATIKRIIQRQQQERIERENNISKNNSQNNVVLQQVAGNEIATTKTTVTVTSSEVNGTDHSKKTNGHFNAQEINIIESDDQMSVDQEGDDLEKDSLNSNEKISNNKNNNESKREIISSSRNQESLNKEPINPEPPPEPPNNENGEPSSIKKNSEKSILKDPSDDKEEEEESSDDSLPDEDFLKNKLEELKARKKQLWQQLRDAIAKQDKKEPAVSNNDLNNNLKVGSSTNYNTEIHEQSHRVDRHNIQSTSYIPSNRDQYDSNYSSSYHHHHEGDITPFHHQLPLGIKRANEQTSPPHGPMNKRIRYPQNGMHYEQMIPGMYGPPPTGPSTMTGNGMMGRDPYSYYHRNEFRPPPPTAPYLDRTYGRGIIQRRLSGNPPTRSAVRPPDRPRGRY